MNTLIKQVNQIYFKYQKLASCLYWLILTVNNVSLKVGTWVGGKAVPCTIPVFDMEAFVSLNLIFTKQPSFPKMWVINVPRWYVQTLKKSRFYCSRRAFHLQSWKRYNSKNIRQHTFTKLKTDGSPLRSDAFVFPVSRKQTPRKKVKKAWETRLHSTRPQGDHTRSRTWTALKIPLPPLHVEFLLITFPALTLQTMTTNVYSMISRSG